MEEIFSVAVSALAFGVAATTAWLTLLRPAQLRVSRPSQIYLGPDSPIVGKPGPPKIYMRLMLVATARRGVVIDSLWGVLHRDETRQSFNVWVHQDGSGQHVRGGGLFVPDTGLVTTHQFLQPRGDSPFDFRGGVYKLEIFARVLGKTKVKLVASEQLTITSEMSQLMKARVVGVYFDQASEPGIYHGEVDQPRLPQAQN